MKQTIGVSGMTCAACVSAVERQVKKLPGVINAEVNLISETLKVEFDEEKCSLQTVMNAVRKAGYVPHVSNAQTGLDKKNKLRRVLISLPFFLMLFYVSMGAMLGLPQLGFLSGGENVKYVAIVQLLLCSPIVGVNYSYFSNGFKRLFKGDPNMDSLIAVSCTACLIFSIYNMVLIFTSDAQAAMHLQHSLHFEGAAMILMFVTTGKYFEASSRSKTSEALNKLKELAPDEITVERDGKVEKIALSKLNIGDIMVVKEGEYISADGEIASGEASINQSAITGESIPVFKKAGDKVYSGTIVEKGYIKIKVSERPENSSIARIIAMVEEAGASKAPISALADKVAGIFVPVVIAIAVVTFIVWLIITGDVSRAFSFGVCVLVVSCPCALGLATPLSIMLGTGKGAERGVLVKSGDALQKLSYVSIIALDKTGTITEGNPEVLEGFYYDKAYSEQYLKSVMFAMESRSNHALAKAVMKYCSLSEIKSVEMTDLKNLTGKGVGAVVDNKQCLIASYAALDESLQGVAQQKYLEYANKGGTPVFLVVGGKLAAALCVKDKIRNTSKAAIKRMKECGIKAVMITGDNEVTAKAIADELEIEYIAGVLPDGKREAVIGLKKEGAVAFVGDGINDAPALTEADVGIAIGAGTDIAIESADAVLIKNDLRDAVYAVNLGKQCIRNIKQNLFWAFFYNCIGIPFAAGAFYWLWQVGLTPGLSALMMSCSSLFVVSNALRLRYFGDKKYDMQEQQDAPNDIADKKQIEKVEIEPIKEEKQQMEKIVKVEGMMCLHCKARVEKIFGALEEVTSCEVDLEGGCIKLQLTAMPDMGKVAATLAEEGYTLIED